VHKVSKVSLQEVIKVVVVLQVLQVLLGDFKAHKVVLGVVVLKVDKVINQQDI
tara:strand:+ start:977 stop:1135 length:159 start_codon:yes stop_codon:yes gene_type:complete